MAKRLSKQQAYLIKELLKQGVPKAEIARKVGVSIDSVRARAETSTDKAKRKAKAAVKDLSKGLTQAEARAKHHVGDKHVKAELAAQRALEGVLGKLPEVLADIQEELHDIALIKERWVRIVLAIQLRMWGDLAAGRDLDKNTALAGSLGTQRVMDGERYLSALLGVPPELPKDDTEARALVKQAMWQRARGGSANNTKALAEALGMKSARSQNIRIRYKPPPTGPTDEDDEDDPDLEEEGAADGGGDPG